MEQFVYDMIHTTEGEKLINYWWLWLIIIILAVMLYIPAMHNGVRTTGKETGERKPKD